DPDDISAHGPADLDAPQNHHDVAGDFALDTDLPQEADDVVVVDLSLRHVRLVRDGDGRRSLADPHVVPPQQVPGVPLGGRGGGPGLRGALGVSRLLRSRRNDTEAQNRRDEGHEDAWQDAWVHRIPPWRSTRGAVLRALAKT